MLANKVGLEDSNPKIDMLQAPSPRIRLFGRASLLALLTGLACAHSVLAYDAGTDQAFIDMNEDMNAGGVYDEGELIDPAVYTVNSGFIKDFGDGYYNLGVNLGANKGGNQLKVIDGGSNRELRQSYSG